LLLHLKWVIETQDVPIRILASLPMPKEKVRILKKKSTTKKNGSCSDSLPKIKNSIFRLNLKRSLKFLEEKSFQKASRKLDSCFFDYWKDRKSDQAISEAVKLNF